MNIVLTVVTPQPGLQHGYGGFVFTYMTTARMKVSNNGIFMEKFSWVSPSVYIQSSFVFENCNYGNVVFKLQKRKKLYQIIRIECFLEIQQNAFLNIQINNVTYMGLMQHYKSSKNVSAFTIFFQSLTLLTNFMADRFLKAMNSLRGVQRDKNLSNIVVNSPER